MITPRRVQLADGRVVRVINAVPESKIVWNADRTKAQLLPDPAIAQVVIPDDLEVHAMPAWLRWLHAVAMCFDGKLFIPRRTKYLLLETLLHELVHHVQRAWMRKERGTGPLHFVATFAWDFVCEFVKHGRDWHDTHLMESESRRIAREILATITTANEREPIDAIAEIKKRLPHHFPPARAA